LERAPKPAELYPSRTVDGPCLTELTMVTPEGTGSEVGRVTPPGVPVGGGPHSLPAFSASLSSPQLATKARPSSISTATRRRMGAGAYCPGYAPLPFRRADLQRARRQVLAATGQADRGPGLLRPAHPRPLRRA